MDELRQIDLDIAKKVLGLKVWWSTDNGDWMCYHPQQPNNVVVLPSYSTNLDHSYRVIYELKSSKCSCHIKSLTVNNKIEWVVSIFKNNKEVASSRKSSLPMAICSSALEFISKVENHLGIGENRNNVIEFPKNR